MSFTTYTKYKPSGIDWAQQIPVYWTCTRLKYTARPGNKTFVDGDWIESPYITEDGIRLLQCGNIGTGKFEEQGFRFISEDTFQKLGCTEVEPNNVLICRLQSSKTILAGRACIAPFLGSKMITSVDNCILKLSEDFDSRYIVYQLSTPAYLSFVEVIARGGTRDRISRSMLGEIPIISPPRNEQKKIADFLGRETSKIDALIEEQQKLIELLKEKRQAVISHAVTKGLNPNAAMKSSGIEWLGDMPSHWDIGPIKRYFRTCSGGTPDTTKRELYYSDSESGIPWIRTTDLQNDSVNEAEVFITEQAIADTACDLVPSGTVLVALYGGDGTVGKNGFLKITASINQALCGLLPTSTHLEDYTFRYIQFYRPFWMVGAESSRKDPNISQEKVRNAPILVPPLNEQIQIAEFLRKETASIDELCDEASRAIFLLQERRTALISAAVTGKIDVHNLTLSETS